MFKTETHMHTSDISPCAILRSDLMVEEYSKKGYKTVFVTEHLGKRFFESLGDLPWENKVTIFLSSYYKAKVRAELLGINVIMAAEFTFENELGDFLVYGIDKDFLLDCPDIYKMGIKAFSEYAHKHGAFIVQAHPYRDNIYKPMPEYVDGLEVYNTNPRHENHTEKTLAVAKEYSLYVAAGSDSHRLEDIACAAILTDTEIKTAQDYIDAIKSGNYKIEVNGEIVK